MKETTRGAGTARQQILDTASVLFYHNGFRAVGIDTIVEQSGVAKMTLYRYFPSKDDLIVAYLERSNLSFWEWFEQAIAPAGDDPRRQLYALFEGVAALCASPQCLGCTFQHAAADFPSLDHPGHRLALAHKRQVLERLREMAANAGASDPIALAAQLLLLMDGAFVASRMFGKDSHARQVTQAAALLLDTQLPSLH
ncbi:MAG: TetR/AcrR family transcriptional regulator [Chloroflexi bacterium]|uniref:TetR/AcrR family transcriptional regulator n=1 Tax=Candidatus Chlorohelix allophototropha TaxID=3003348 RepID=A0A8T7M1Y6_9CHLR|nr:TetR/AcrR family transcriptional regulator [Chloroflexota bacterium]WJW65557.1 TetR/AcrR family transcriptional regulator [Chloroflexota bacterium L227-S17]